MTAGVLATVVLLAVDNHRTRAIVDRHVQALDDATLISGGNDETDGNVQLGRRSGRDLVTLAADGRADMGKLGIPCI